MSRKLAEVKEEAIVVVDPLGREKEIKTRAVVVAVGMRPETTLCEDLKKAGIATRMAGDCVEARKIMDAIHEGFFAALWL